MVVGAIVPLVAVFLAILAYTRLTMFDPFSSFFKGSRVLSDGAAFVHWMLVLSALASVVARFRRLELTVTVGVGVICFIVLLAWVRLGGSGADDMMRLSVGRHAWWLTLPMVLLVVFLSAGFGVAVGRSWSWRSLWGVGFGSLLVGMVVYGILDPGGVILMVAKALFVLMVPAVVLLATAIYYRGKRAGLVRFSVFVVALLLLAAATIR